MGKSILIVLLMLFFIFSANALVAAEERLELTANASSVYCGLDAHYGANRLLDGKMNTYWIGESRQASWWITFDTGAVNTIGRVKIFWYNSSFAPKDYDIQVSSDGLSWEDIFSGITGVYSKEGEEKAINRDTRYIRFYIRSVLSIFPVIREFEAYESEGLPISRTMRFRGKLKDADGLPLQGLFEIKFRLYKRETEGAPAWQETQTDVAVEEGLLDVELGSVTPLALDFNKQYWLSVEVESDGEMTPRFKLTCVPYSLGLQN